MSSTKARRKVCVAVHSRANYGRIKSVMQAIRDNPNLELQLIVGASGVLQRFGAVVNVLRDDGFEPNATVYTILEGETPTTMAKSTGMAILELATQFENLEARCRSHRRGSFRNHRDRYRRELHEYSRRAYAGWRSHRLDRRKRASRGYQAVAHSFSGHRESARIHHPDGRGSGYGALSPAALRSTRSRISIFRPKLDVFSALPRRRRRARSRPAVPRRPATSGDHGIRPWPRADQRDA